MAETMCDMCWTTMVEFLRSLERIDGDVAPVICPECNHRTSKCDCCNNKYVYSPKYELLVSQLREVDPDFRMDENVLTQDFYLAIPRLPELRLDETDALVSDVFRDEFRGGYVQILYLVRGTYGVSLAADQRG